MPQNGNPRLTNLRQILAAKDANHAWHFSSCVGVYAQNFRVGDRRTPKHHMSHPRQFNIVEISSKPLDEAASPVPRLACSNVALILCYGGKSKLG
jgi:hypothetical protein